MATDPRLRNLFLESLRLVHAAHHQGAEQAKANAASSSLPLLKRTFEAGAKLNLVQARRLEPIFKTLGRDIENRTDRAMGGIVDANRELLAKADGRAMRDLGNVASGQVAAHFFIATYGTLRAYARTLGNRGAVAAFDRTLAETGKVDREFTALASHIRAHAGDGAAYASESALYTAAALHPARTAATGFALVAAGAVALVALMPPPAPAPRGVRRLWSR